MMSSEATHKLHTYVFGLFFFEENTLVYVTLAASLLFCEDRLNTLRF